MNNKVLELFGVSAQTESGVDWSALVRRQWCPFLDRKCVKVRKSAPEIAVGTCAVRYGKDNQPVVICPHRLLERKQVFSDCLHLLTDHEPGNELHIVPELTIPGGSVDYFLASVRSGKVLDFVGIELQTLDTTGTVWPERQRLLHDYGVKVRSKDVKSPKSFGMNWKMTAKTVLVQLHHKVQTFEKINRHLVLVVQDCFLDYVRRAFSFDHLSKARLGDPVHFHAYRFVAARQGLRLDLAERFSTDTTGVATCLGLKASAQLEWDQITRLIESKLSDETRFMLSR